MIGEAAEERAPGVRVIVVICELRGAASRLICSETIRVYLVWIVSSSLGTCFVSRDSSISVETDCGDDSRVCLVGHCGDGIDCVKLAGWIKAVDDEVIGIFFEERRIL